MTTLLKYLAESGLYLAVFYACYLVVMRNTTFFRLNRAAILAGTLICLTTPLAHFSVPDIFSAQANDSQAEGMLVRLREAVVTDMGGSDISPASVLTVIYLVRVLAVLVDTIFGIWRIMRIIRTGTPASEGSRIILTDADIPSFSWFGYIVMGRKDYEENPAILAHEDAHLRCRHSADIMFMRIVSALQWFNPMVWIAVSELKMMHEYEADEQVISTGVDASEYQLLLVRKTVGDRRFKMANGFNYSKL